MFVGVVGVGEIGVVLVWVFIDLLSRFYNRYFFVRYGELVLDVWNGGMILSNLSFKYDIMFGLMVRG